MFCSQGNDIIKKLQAEIHNLKSKVSWLVLVWCYIVTIVVVAIVVALLFVTFSFLFLLVEAS